MGRTMMLAGADHTPDGQGVVLMRVMTAQELDTLEKLGQYEARKELPCLLCTRYTMTQLAEQYALDAVECPDVTCSFQWFYNEVQTPEGYARQYCLLPNERHGHTNGITLPVARFCQSLYRIVHDGRRWRVNQDAQKTVCGAALPHCKTSTSSSFPSHF